MGKRLARVKDHLRTWVQIGFAALSNGYAAGFMRGNIYKGPLKFACVPGLNCYSCPGALGSCPIGAFQSVLASRDYHFAFYVSGFLIFFGAGLVTPAVLVSRGISFYSFLVITGVVTMALHLSYQRRSARQEVRRERPKAPGGSKGPIASW